MQVNLIVAKTFPVKILEKRMPEHDHSTSNKKGKLRTRVILKRGEIISLCRCWQSKNFPLCDSSHKDLEGAMGPVVVQTNCNEDFIKKTVD